MTKEIVLMFLVHYLYAHSVLECDFEEANKCEWQFTNGPGQPFAFHIENGRRQGPKSEFFLALWRLIDAFCLANRSVEYFPNPSKEELSVVKRCFMFHC